MARLPRIVIPGLPHHVTQRGNGRAQTFFSAEDYAAYVELLKSAARAEQVSILSWCLMPNHVHLLLCPATVDGITRMMSRVNRTYASLLHRRLQRTGHFWQGRFGCIALDDAHFSAALAYVLMNPVRARLCDEARQWRWSNARSLCENAADPLCDTNLLLAIRPDLQTLLATKPVDAIEPDEFTAIRRGETIGRPAGSLAFLEQLEAYTGRVLQPQKRGPKPNTNKHKPVKTQRKARFSKD